MENCSVLCSSTNSSIDDVPLDFNWFNSTAGDLFDSSTIAPNISDNEAVPINAHRSLFHTFSLFPFILLVISFCVLIVWIVLGNLLVLISIATTPRLRLSSNYLIANLALSDLLLGAIIIPFSGVNEILGWWPFGQGACTYWLVADVFICTASIWSLLAIAMDRCTATFFPTWYRTVARDKRRRALLLYVMPIWVISGALCIYSFFGFKDRLGGGFRHKNGLPICVLFDECNFVVFSALTTFYLPTTIMIIIYIRIYIALHKRNAQWVMNRAQRASSRSNRLRNGKLKKGPRAGLRKGIAKEGDSEITDDTCTEFRTDDSGTCTSDMLSRDSADIISRSAVDSVASLSAAGTADEQSMVTLPSTATLPCVDETIEEPGSCGEDADDEDAVTTGGIPLRSKYKRKKMKRIRKSIASGTKLLKSITKHVRGSSRRRYERKEQRATKITLCILITVIGCWLPFFVFYLVDCFCDGCITDQPVLYPLAFWLGYLNSGINPILYTVFNRNFRIAFQKLLCQKKAKPR